MEKKLFDLVASLDLSNIDDHDGMSIHLQDDSQDNKQYRIYHKDGYCFDVTRYTNDAGKDNYSYYSLWDGFNELFLSEAIELIEKEGVFL